ncbi:MAG: hypothetical protein CSA32_03950 [Desulfobulbus propionicus]|nr:MAG: hypothetical protein CSA32_03950 [Desulfobulbus propionicus]
MREAVSMVQMVFFQALKNDLGKRTEPEDQHRLTMLAGAVVNNLFGTEPSDQKIVDFANKNRDLVEQELRQVAIRLSDLCPFLTDALRMKVICDNQEGIYSIPSLLMARELGILQETRALPMPSTFMLSVRTLAAEKGLIETAG